MLHCSLLSCAWVFRDQALCRDHCPFWVPECHKIFLIFLLIFSYWFLNTSFFLWGWKQRIGEMGKWGRGNETEDFPLLFWICSICSFKNIFVCSPKWWKWVWVSLRSCAAGGWLLSSPWSTWGFREESSPGLGKEKLPGWVMTLRSTLRFQECTMPLSCLFSQLPGSSLQLWDWALGHRMERPLLEENEGEEFILLGSRALCGHSSGSLITGIERLGEGSCSTGCLQMSWFRKGKIAFFIIMCVETWYFGYLNHTFHAEHLDLYWKWENSSKQYISM